MVARRARWAVTDPETLITTAQGSWLRDRRTLRRLARNLECPVLVVHDDRDKITPPRDGRVLARLSDGELEVVHGAGHFPHARKPVLSSRRTNAAKTAAVGASDGNIIAAIIVAHTPVNQPTEPRAVPGPASIPAIRSAVDHHANPAAASSAATIPSSVRIAVSGAWRATPPTPPVALMTAPTAPEELLMVLPPR